MRMVTMKITGIDTWLVQIPLRGAFRNTHTIGPG